MIGSIVRGIIIIVVSSYIIEKIDEALENKSSSK